MASKIVPGKYLGKIIDHGITNTSAGNPQVVLRFDFLDKDGDKHELNWYGTLKEGKGREITLKALVTCGLTTTDLSLLCDGVESGALDTENLVNLAVELKVGTDNKERPTIAWINDGTGGGLTNEVPKEEAKQKLSALGISNDISALLGSQGKKLATKTAAAPMASPAVDQIPF